MRDPMDAPCRDWEKKLAAIYPDDLLPAEREVLTNHVMSCSACAPVLMEYREMVALLRRSLAPRCPLELPKDFAVGRRQHGGTERSGEPPISPGFLKKDSQGLTRLWESQDEHEAVGSALTRKTHLKSTRAAQSSAERSSLALAGDASASSPSYEVRLLAQCLSKYTEVLPDELLSPEVLVEVHVGQILLSLFEEVAIEDVSLHSSPTSLKGQQLCSVQVNAQCQSGSLSPRLPALRDLELIVKKAVRNILRELFGAVKIEEVSIRSSTGSKVEKNDILFKSA